MKKLVAGLGLCTAAVWAQSADQAKRAAEERNLVISSEAPPTVSIDLRDATAKPVTGAPYSAQPVTERTQTLADGNRIVQTTTGMVARDSKGRVRRDESLAVALPGSSGEFPKLETIDDPVAGAHWTLDPQTKIAIKGGPIGGPARRSLTLASPLASLPQLAPGGERTFFYTSGAPGSQLSVHKLDKKLAEEQDDVGRVDLGTQMVEGVKAHGTRVTRTIPANSIGNELPIVITSETWYSPELQTLVMSKAEDPRMGVVTYRLTNIQRGEPDASLFQVPADFTVKDKPEDRLYIIKKDH